jgi:TRAP-type transport system periplasmic protein
MFKKILYVLSALFFVSGLFFTVVPTLSAAEQIELTFAHPYSPMHPQHVGVLMPWAQNVEKESNGQVKIKFMPGGAIGKPGQVYDMVAKGLADIGWDICDYSAGKFPLTTVIELPFMVKTAERSSVALWKTYAKFPAFQKEYAETKLLALSAHSPGFFATAKKPIKELNDLKGMKIKTASSFTTDAMQLFGAVPVTQPVTETYTSLERGVLDGVVNPFDGIVVFKLHELLKYYTPADFYSLVFWITMNKDKFNSLPANSKKAIEKNSGEILSKLHGSSFDESYAKNKIICQQKGMQEVPFPKTEMDKLIKITAPLKDKWVKDMDAKGLPGKTVLETITAMPR